jgi:Protein of unknown function (DUF4238)
MPTAEGDRHHFVPEFLLRRFQGRTSAGRRLDKSTDEDRGNIAYLIAAQEQRVPGALEDLRRSLVIAGTTHAAVDLANTTGSRRRRRRGQEAYSSLVEGRVSLSPSPEAVLQMALLNFAHVAGLIYRLPWTVLQASPDAGRFITSDRPLTMFDPTPPHKFAAPAWLSSANVAAGLPLSQSTCLRISPRDRGPLTWRDTSKQVERLNRFTYAFADRWVYGPSADALEALHDQATNSPELFPTPIPKRMVLLEDLETADPRVADRNAARGWDRYLVVRDDGVERLMSYEVIDSLEDAMEAIAPRPTQHLAKLETLSPTDLRGS